MSEIAYFPPQRPSRIEAELAVRTLLRWMGEDPNREGLAQTPKRVVDAFTEHSAGYDQDPSQVLQSTFAETQGYNGMVILNDYRFVSHCEHHLKPIIGKAHVGYLADNSVVGISKLSRLVNVFANRLQIQERITAQIADAIVDELNPRWVGVAIEAEHHCMTTRGVHAPGTMMFTMQIRGVLAANQRYEQNFLRAIGKS